MDYDSLSYVERSGSNDGGRRGWLIGAGVGMVALVVAIVVLSRGGGSGGMPGMDMGGTDMSGMDSGATSAQLRLPPGMPMSGEMSAAAMAGMAAIDPDDVDAVADPGARGDRLLRPNMDGVVKEFRLTASVVEWTITDGTQVLAYAYNEQVPGPRLQLVQGDAVRVIVRNDLPEPTTVHWHGLIVPNEMDGPAEITQEPILPGDEFAYEFTVEQSGTFFYHSHTNADRQQALGLSGALIVTQRDAAPTENVDVVIQLQEWTIRDGANFPSMPMEGLLPNFFTINGKSWPNTETIRATVGQPIRFRFIGAGAFAHPMHVHGGPFTIVATDGEPVPAAAQLRKDTVNVSPGERYDVVWTPSRPGTWLLHCHINHHTTNDGGEVAGAGGLTMRIEVA